MWTNISAASDNLTEPHPSLQIPDFEEKSSKSYVFGELARVQFEMKSIFLKRNSLLDSKNTISGV